MNLISGRLYSEATYPNPPVYPVLEEDLSCEVLVVGGGEAGALISHALHRQGIETVLIDKRFIAGGTSSASTGLLQFENDKSLTSCIRSFGEHKGVRLYQLCAQALDSLRKLTLSLDSDCEFRNCGSLRYATSPADVELLRTEYHTLRRYGFQVELWNEEDIAKRYSFRKAAAMYSLRNAQVNLYKLVHALVESSYWRGMRVFERTEIKTFRHDKNGPSVMTSNGKTIRARKIVFATGYETQEFRMNPNVCMTSSFAIVTQPVDPAFPLWYERSLIWETARPYLYMRTTADNRIICGGLDENIDSPEEREHRMQQKSEMLLERLGEMFPQYGELRAEYAWGAFFMNTHDGYPFFGEQDGYPDCYFALGYGGNGSVCNAMGAEIICELITKGYHPDAELFAFEREKYATAVGRF
jgi:glycine/D-amino acid oxidase-like deaminating enzyme